ncbi:siphovirus ReqiPepy6 Gp37-like family protein [Alkalibacter rhizosphaerae]|uniref:Siphovirus ReqiPepy6 Gp37-like family protein n=1 Tax=Alkalibacter rhizosphaerae TaxID=2815577 RepID=A0A974XH01_9FIRM|nr:siphovirus ReqiPepy6 Gp37-like family protein [Alkalibacter rhizosphaerae]QSX09531.1 siphovirus ReqiPepy6 Gp37-like family protein [Alkalibacter rhizosphaerae]
MEIYIFNEQRALEGIIESFEYFRWTRRYSFCGGFELKAPATKLNISLLKVGSILWKNDDEEAGIIEYFELSQTGKETLVVSGRFTTSMIGRRIIWGSEVLTTDLSLCIDQLLNNHLISPTDPDRQMESFSFTPENLDIPVNTQISNENLLDAITALCDASQVGIKTVFDPASANFTVVLYQGVQSQAVFSKEYENLTDQVFTNSDRDFANTALIGGEGEGTSRIYTAITQGAGENRRELFVDAKDLRQEDFGASYEQALLFRGVSKLAERQIAQSFDASVNLYGNLIYKVDYDLGQEVLVLSSAWGVSLNTRITEIEEIYDASGWSVNVVFGKGILTLQQKLKGVR